MKISVISDTHFGFGTSSELEDDSYENASEAFEKSTDCDLIILAGDVFDSRVPRTQTWGKALKVLTKPLLKENPGVKLVESSKQLKEISRRTLNHIPVIAIHGTHERRGGNEINAIEALENAGILIYLHKNYVIFEKEGRKVAIFGMSAVPESFAKGVLDYWNPKPLPDCYNILVIHQSVSPYIYSPLEPPSLSLSNLPKEFDLIIDGHIHKNGQDKIGDSIFLIVGSTLTTQMERSEAEIEKGFVKIEINSETKISFVPLESARKFFYKEIKILQGASLKDQINQVLYPISNKNYSKKPLVKIKIFGKENEVLDQELREVERTSQNRLILTIAKDLESPEITEKIEFLRNLRENKLSIEEMGMQILKKNLDELKFDYSVDYDNLFRMLSEGESERAFQILLGEQITLTEVLKRSLK